MPADAKQRLIDNIVSQPRQWRAAANSGAADSALLQSGSRLRRRRREGVGAEHRYDHCEEAGQRGGLSSRERIGKLLARPHQLMNGANFDSLRFRFSALFALERLQTTTSAIYFRALINAPGPAGAQHAAPLQGIRGGLPIAGEENDVAVDGAAREGDLASIGRQRNSKDAS